jgi:opacity protein-like surface antigen
MASFRPVTLLAVPLIAVLAAPPAAAQSDQRQRGFAIGFGGATFTEVNAPVFGGSVGVNLTPDIQVTGDFGRMQDVFANFTREDLGILERDMLTEEGVNLTTRVKMPTTYAIGSVRFLLPTSNPIRPYLTAGGGVAHLNPKPAFVADGLDITSLVLQDAELNATFKTENRPMVTGGAGLTFAVVRHLTVDLGYKYSRIFIDKVYLQAPAGFSPHQHDGIDVHRFILGAGFTF